MLSEFDGAADNIAIVAMGRRHDDLVRRFGPQRIRADQLVEAFGPVCVPGLQIEFDASQAADALRLVEVLAAALQFTSSIEILGLFDLLVGDIEV